MLMSGSRADGLAAAVTGVAAQDLADVLAVSLRYGDTHVLLPIFAGGADSVIAASDIYSAGVDGEPICSTKRDREALGANGSPKYCVSWATLPSLNCMMLTV